MRNCSKSKEHLFDEQILSPYVLRKVSKKDVRAVSTNAIADSAIGVSMIADHSRLFSIQHVLVVREACTNLRSPIIMDSNTPQNEVKGDSFYTSGKLSNDDGLSNSSARSSSTPEKSWVRRATSVLSKWGVETNGWVYQSNSGLICH